MATLTIIKPLVPMAFALLGAGALSTLFSGYRTSNRALSVVLLTGAVALLVACFAAWPRGFMLFGPTQLQLADIAPLMQTGDALSLFFLALLSIVTIAVALFSPGYLDHLSKTHNCHKGIYWFSLFTFVGSMAEIFLAADAITFIIFWELMALSSVGLVLTDHASHKARKAAVIYLGATRISSTLIFGGFLWMHYLSHSWLFADWKVLGSAAYAPQFILFLGFCIKAGTWPFHLWLPYAHSEAPAPVSALMSGVMVKVAIYGMLRLIVMGDHVSPVLAYSVLIVGAISAFWGITFAQVEDDLKRLLAYSTIENVGLIILSIGLVLLTKNSLGPVASVALAGCFFHVLNHGLYKPLLFLCAGAVDWQAHTRKLSHLGGLQKYMPWTAAMFFFGSMAICALPPLNGFVSKWLIYQSLFDFALTRHSIFDRAAGITLIGLLSMIGAMSIAAFAKAFTMAFLGPLHRGMPKAQEVPMPARFGQAMLVGVCVALAIVASLTVQSLAPLSTHVIARYDVPVRLPQAQLVIALLILWPALYAVLINFGRRNLKRFSTWECGFGYLPARARIAATSFSRTLADAFGMVIQFHAENKISGRDRRHFPDRVEVVADQTFLVEKWIYEPIYHVIDAVGKGLIKLQTGSIHIHLLYVFATLILLTIIGSLK